MACCSILHETLHKDIISLSDYVRGLVISDKRRYLEKIYTTEIDVKECGQAAWGEYVPRPAWCLTLVLLGES